MTVLSGVMIRVEKIRGYLYYKVSMSTTFMRNLKLMGLLMVSHYTEFTLVEGLISSLDVSPNTTICRSVTITLPALKEKVLILRNKSFSATKEKENSQSQVTSFYSHAVSHLSLTQLMKLVFSTPFHR